MFFALRRGVWCLILLAGSLPAAEVLAPVSTDDARRMAFRWAETRPDYLPEAVPLMQAVWMFSTPPSPPERLDAVLQTFYIVDPDVRQLVDACASPQRPGELLEFPALHTSADQPFYSHNVRAFYARFLAVVKQYDEALELYDEIEPQQLVDPASALFYRAVCEHALLRRDEGLATIKILLEQTEQVPLRHKTVAELMRHDLEGLEEKSLGEVARQMKDVERRLDLGHAGQRVQRQGDRIIASLDEIIEKLEQQQGGGGGGGGSQGQQQGNQSSNPADDSYTGGVKGPGEVDPKSAGHEAGWGNLPEKEQAQVKNMLDKQFPSHYRQAVTEYLRKLAQRPAPTP
ncbi:MAG: hypothetical protein ACK5Q5_20100 [Planctomycetaceae bacterium]